MGRGKSRRRPRLRCAATAGSRRHWPRPATGKGHRAGQGSFEKLQRSSSAAQVSRRQGIVVIPRKQYDSLKREEAPQLSGPLPLLGLLTASRVARNASPGRSSLWLKGLSAAVLAFVP